MKNNIKKLVPALVALVATLAFGVMAPLASQANNAQIKVTHAARKDSGTQVAARPTNSGATEAKFRVAVMPAPEAPAPAAVNSATPKYIHR